MTQASKWAMSKDPKGNEVYTWKEYEVSKVYERRVIAASYLSSKTPPVYGDVGSWKAKFQGQVIDTGSTPEDPVSLMEYCERHDSLIEK